MYAVGLDKKDIFILYSQETFYFQSWLKVNITMCSCLPTSISREKNENDNIKEILFGSLLGDGKLEMAPRAKNARFGFIQAELHKEYFLFFLSKLSLLGSINYRESTYLDKRTNKTYKSLNFWTKSLPELTELYNVFYIDKVKVVPKDLSLLSPIALAHWIMQDGSRSTSKGLYLCTDSFSEAEVKYLAEYLKDRYKISCSIHKANGRFRIYILAKSVPIISNFVAPFMHKSMLYKLGI